MTSAALFRTLRANMPPETVVVEESPSNLGELHAAWPVEREDSFYTFASGSLGWNLPAAVGITLAERDAGRNRPVVAIIGDGSMQYAIQALWTAARQELPLIVVVPQNGQYAILKSFAALENTPGVPGLDIPGLDFEALGAGYGCTSLVARTEAEVAKACTDALARSGPTVIAVPVEPTIPPLL